MGYHIVFSDGPSLAACSVQHIRERYDISRVNGNTRGHHANAAGNGS